MLVPARVHLVLVAIAVCSLACSDDGGGGPEVNEDAAWCDEVADWDDAWTTFEDQVVVLVNQRRAEGAVCGGETFGPAGGVVMDPALRCAARRHSLDMADRNYFSHDTPEGVSPWDRADMAEYDANAIGENIAAGHGTPEAVVQGWMDSSGHCSNIMNPNANEIGVGYLTADAADFGSYWTQVFGRR